MNEVQSCVTQIGQERTHYAERERESSMESGQHGCISSFSSLAEKQLWSVWKKRMFLPIMRALQTTTTICDSEHRGSASTSFITLTREPLVYDKYRPHFSSSAVGLSESSLNHKFTQTDVCKWYMHCSERCSSVLWSNGSMQGLK